MPGSGTWQDCPKEPFGSTGRLMVGHPSRFPPTGPPATTPTAAMTFQEKEAILAVALDVESDAEIENIYIKSKSLKIN